MKDEIVFLLKEVMTQMGLPAGKAGVADIEPEVTIPENPEHGDYSTNIALRLSKILKNLPAGRQESPMDIALQVRDLVNRESLIVNREDIDQNTMQKHQKISRETAVKDVLQDIDRVEVLPPGFINLFVSEARLSSHVVGLIKEEKGVVKSQLTVDSSQFTDKKKIMVEFAHPNTHKAFHIGHLRNITTGESIVRLLEATGHEVIRANYQGDVGMHIAKCLYTLMKMRDIREKIADVRKKEIHDKVEFLGKAYAAGSQAYEEDEAAKKEIGEINKKIYAKDPEVYSLYQETRQWSLDYFEQIYKRVGSHFDRYYFESEAYESGKKIVLEGLEKGIFEKSEGAIIFPGEKFKLHNRVFITSEGNPTYEGKDMGLAPLQFGEYHPDLIIHVVGPEQAGYFQVVFEALAQMFPEMRGREYHLIYGWVKLKQGKMSSRTGNVVLGEWLLDEAKKEIYKILEKSQSKYNETEKSDIAEKAAVAAVKYAFLKVGTTSEIAFDLKESVNFLGDSGPYLQYTYARCRSVMRKAGKSSRSTVDSLQKEDKKQKMNLEERAVARLLLYFDDIVTQAAEHYAPSALCSYLFQLSQAYNLFYAKHSILGSSLQSTVDSSQKDEEILSVNRELLSVNLFRLSLTAAVSQVLKDGLYLLGIEALEQM